MGGGKGGKAPRAPDYAGLARQQSQADMDVAKYLTNANRLNQTAPTGTSTFTKSYSDPAKAQQYQDYIKQADYELGRGYWAPHNAAKWQAERDRQQKLLDELQTWEQTTKLTPEEQAIFNANQQNRLGMEGLAGTAIGRAGQTLGSDFNPQLMDFYRAQGLGGDNVGLYGNTLEGMQDVMEGSDQFKQQGEQVRDAMYRQMTRFNDERFGEEEARERSRLQQLGLQEGTQAYQNALQEFRRSKDEAYGGAQLQSILAGGQEQSRMYGDLLAGRQSNIGLRQGQFQQGMSRDQMDLSERQARATNELNLAQLFGQQRGQQFQEQSYLRSLPINEIAALLSGGGVQMPQFSGYSQATPFQAPDMLGAAQAGYGAQMGRYNAGQQQKGSLLGAGASLAGGFLGGK